MHFELFKFYAIAHTHIPDYFINNDSTYTVTYNSVSTHILPHRHNSICLKDNDKHKKHTDILSANTISHAARLSHEMWYLIWLWHQRENVPRYWTFVRGIHLSPVASPHKVRWRGALVFFIIYTWIKYNVQPTIETLVIPDAIVLIITSLLWRWRVTWAYMMGQDVLYIKNGRIDYFPKCIVIFLSDTFIEISDGTYLMTGPVSYQAITIQNIWVAHFLAHCHIPQHIIV